MSLRVALVGCGAAGTLLHVPAVAGLAGVRLAAFVDTNAERAAAASAQYRRLRAHDESVIAADIGEVLEGIDAAIIAAPHVLHVPLTERLLRAGKHVLVEKPLSLAAGPCKQLAALAAERELVLAVGYVRRLFPSSPWVRELIRSGALGQLSSVTWREGMPYRWPTMTASLFRPESALGGVMCDTGSHVIDQLCWWLTPEDLALVTFADSSRGGVDAEAECVLRSGDTRVEVALSRLRQLSNTCVLEGSNGWLRVGTGFDADFVLRTDGRETRGTVAAREDAAASWDDLFVRQLRRFAGAIAGSDDPVADAGDAAAVAAVIGTAYTRATPLRRTWQSVEGADRAPVRRQRIAVTGASGFIAGRATELMAARGNSEVVAVVRSYSRGARLSELDPNRVQFAKADVRDPRALRAAFEGCDVVIHAAFGSEGGDQERWDTTVDGTRAVVEAATAAGVRRLVYMSTASVRETSNRERYDENTPYLEPLTGDMSYPQAKLQAEKVARGFPSELVVLQPTVVYGPWGVNWTSDVLSRLRRDDALLPSGHAGGVCNLVFIDDLARLIAKIAQAERASGTFIVSGERVAWGEFFDAFRGLLGLATGAERFASEQLPAWERELYDSVAVADYSTARAALGYAPRVDLPEGIARVAEWSRWLWADTGRP